LLIIVTRKMPEPYATSLSIVKLKGRSRQCEKNRSIVSLINEKLAGTDFTADVTELSLIQSLCCCVEAAVNKKNKKNKVDKLSIVLEISAALKKAPLTVAEKATITAAVEFLLASGLVKGTPLFKLVAKNAWVFLKKALL
jgi:prophage DNA circulation protein